MTDSPIAIIRSVNKKQAVEYFTAAATLGNVIESTTENSLVVPGSPGVLFFDPSALGSEFVVKIEEREG